MTTKEELIALFDKFDSLKVLVIGDVMIDSYLWGKVERISPEAPVPVVTVKNREYRLGGAANVALNVQAMGAEPILCCITGSDEDGQRFLDLLNTHNLSSDGVLEIKDRPTTIKHRILSGTQQMLRVDSETDALIKPEEETIFISKIESLLPKVDVVLFEDYDKGTITKGVIDAVVSYCSANNIPVSVDPKKRNFWNYAGVTLFKPNLKEIVEGLNQQVDKKNLLEEVNRLVAELNRKMPVKQTFVTLSEKGVYIGNGEEFKHVPAHFRNISDVSGAGDTVISVATLCLALGVDNLLLAKLANLSGGLVCEKVGVVPIDKQELLEEAIEKITKN